jgi:Uma2 family endonuclease
VAIDVAPTIALISAGHDAARPVLSRRYNEPMSGSDRVNPANPGVKLTYDDFVLFPDDGLRHELIDGEHYVTPSPNTRHQRISGNLFLLMGTWLDEHAIGRLFYAPFDVVFSNFDVVEPDLLYLSNERAADVITPQHVRGAPNLVIEIGSPGTRGRDETIKRKVYERSREAGDVLTTPLLPGLDLPLSRIFRESR